MRYGKAVEDGVQERLLPQNSLKNWRRGFLRLRVWMRFGVGGGETVGKSSLMVV